MMCEYVSMCSSLSSSSQCFIQPTRCCCIAIANCELFALHASRDLRTSVLIARSHVEASVTGLFIVARSDAGFELLRLMF